MNSQAFSIPVSIQFSAWLGILVAWFVLEFFGRLYVGHVDDDGRIEPRQSLASDVRLRNVDVIGTLAPPIGADVRQSKVANAPT